MTEKNTVPTSCYVTITMQNVESHVTKYQAIWLKGAQRPKTIPVRMYQAIWHKREQGLATNFVTRKHDQKSNVSQHTAQG
ncbi:hypothetical protein XELAEV_18020047mg [Xenopus laevis]|uniref:Uncharacterized protein n=1 Tax=Xenopus laevis TaxID=8355 RepID=A0A974D6E6_XENLA|nr:hypothetical protein XELAEV_18020047mg [Xenopus laevis]